MLESMDLISSLHDDLLLRVLSFLSTKEAYKTSFLSKRWRNLWKGVQNLDIDDSVFFYPKEKGTVKSFTDFVDRVLASQGDSTIKKFSLKCKIGVDGYRVNEWICNVLKRGVSDIDLVLDFPIFYLMPWKSLGDNNSGSSRPTEKLPKLKTLNIDSKQLAYLWDKNLEGFVSSLPMLEELRLAAMQWFYCGDTVSSARLRKLTLHNKVSEEFSVPENFSFETPNLVYLEYSDYVAADYPRVNLTNIVEARLDLLTTKKEIKLIRAQPIREDNIVIQRFRNVSKLMSGMRNVQKLILTADTLEVLSLSCDSMPVFNNLKFLYIASHKERGWQAMPVLLRNSPHLETIVLRGLLHHETDKCGDACDCIVQGDKEGRSLRSCPVKMLKIKGFLGTTKEMAMIKHFLKCFLGLKKMDIFVEEDEPTELRVLEVRERILQMIKDYNNSSSCDIQLLFKKKEAFA